MSEKPITKLRSFQADEKQYSIFKSNLAKEGEDLGDKINEFIATYNKEHGDGNPAYKITDFQDKDFIATPALARNPEAIRKYLESIYGTPEWDKISNIVQQNWVNQFNQVEKSHL